MGIEPPASEWSLPDPLAADPDGVCGVGADLAPGTILAAYRRGLFPMHLDGRARVLAWWSPDPRGIIPVGELRISRSLRRSLRRFEIRIDHDFRGVIEACAEPRPRGGHWIHPVIIDAYSELHRLGWAHSIEAYDADSGALAGGLYGIAIGGLFAGESMFHRATDASKVALAAAVDLLERDGLFDVQWTTPHLESLGAVGIPAVEYQERLAHALTLPLPEAFKDA